MKHVAVPEPGGGGGGSGSDKAHDSTRDIKSDLAKPLTRLCKQYTQMFDILKRCDANVEAACTFLKNDMTETFKEVAWLVDMSFTPPFTSIFTSIEDGSEKTKEAMRTTRERTMMTTRRKTNLPKNPEVTVHLTAAMAVTLNQTKNARPTKKLTVVQLKTQPLLKRLTHPVSRLVPGMT